MRKYLENLYIGAANLNRKNIVEILENRPESKLLDLGCDDGTYTLELANKIGTKDMSGVEIVPERIKMAEENKIAVENFDLNEKFNYVDESFDVIHANQVIEHLYDSDNFLSEIYRVLKHGGYAVISTENASSWCNIFASVMGWQIFSLTNISSKKLGIGNPFALHRHEGSGLNSWNHVRIYNIRGLKELCEAHVFVVEMIKGAGYFPMPNSWGDIDKTHCHFMTLKLRKR
jgi:SAM-dependent methyltransferase